VLIWEGDKGGVRVSSLSGRTVRVRVDLCGAGMACDDPNEWERQYCDSGIRTSRPPGIHEDPAVYFVARGTMVSVGEQASELQRECGKGRPTNLCAWLGMLYSQVTTAKSIRTNASTAPDPSMRKQRTTKGDSFKTDLASTVCNP
jgi:hypothetical protein